MKNTMIIDSNWMVEGATDIDFIRSNERVISRGTKHAPLSSADILTKFREKANVLGLQFKNEKGALLRTKQNKHGEIVGGDRYMYTAEVVDDNHPDYALSVGFRNFGDKSLSFSGMCGTHIFVCQNGCCSSIVKDSRMRHTIGNVSCGFIDEKIDNIFSRFLEDSESIHTQIATMKGTKLSNELLGAFVRKAVGEWKVKGDEKVFVPNPYIGAKNISLVLADLENPEYNDNNDNSVFRLHNACTKVTTHNFRNPNQSVMASRYFNNLILGLIDPNFKPLGDVIDITEETDIVE